MRDLEFLRNQIDEQDRAIVKAIEKRFLTVKEIISYKRENNLPIYQPAREKEVLEKVNSYLATEEFSHELKSIYIEIMNKSKEIQNKNIYK